MVSKKRYGEQKGGQKRGTIAKLKKTVKELAGGDEQLLLQDLYMSRFCKKYDLPTSTESSDASKSIHNAEPKLRKICERIKERYNAAENNDKRQWATLLVGALTYNETKDFGFTITRKTFAKVRKQLKNESKESFDDDGSDDESAVSPTSTTTSSSTSSMMSNNLNTTTLSPHAHHHAHGIPGSHPHPHPHSHPHPHHTLPHVPHPLPQHGTASSNVNTNLNLMSHIHNNHLNLNTINNNLSNLNNINNLNSLSAMSAMSNMTSINSLPGMNSMSNHLNPLTNIPGVHDTNHIDHLVHQFPPSNPHHHVQLPNMSSTISHMVHQESMGHNNAQELGACQE